MIRFFLRSTCLLLLVPFFISCVENDQTVVKPEHQFLANPTPIERDFVGNNSRHKVLLAVFDSGIDYNHPELLNNVHFELGADGKPVSAGKDYLGNDNWAAWNRVATNKYEFKYLNPEAQEDQLRTTTEAKYNIDLQRQIGERQCLVTGLLKIEPRLGKYIHPYRATEDEASGTALHGTHVSGLMVYDRPDFGLVPYRILPYYQNRQDKIDNNVGKSDKFVDNFADAVADASQKGVRIINLSLGGSFTRPDTEKSVADEAKLEKFRNYSRIITGKLTDIIKAYPHILFVAAAGNDSGWSDNESRVQYPCGVEAENILCVGALNPRNTFTTFTNVPFNNIDLVFAPGAAIKSLSPSDRCPFIDQLIESFLKESSGAALCSYKGAEEGWAVDAAAEVSKATIIKAAYDACSYKPNLYTRMSGTSMATPIVSHLAAEILAEKPMALARDLILEIKSRAQMKQGKSFISFSLTSDRLKEPLWNATPGVAPAVKVQVAAAPKLMQEMAAIYKYLGLDLPVDPTQGPFQVIMGKQDK